MNDDRVILPEDHQQRQDSPEYLTALAKLHDSMNAKPGLTARQQFILELLRTYIQANGGLTDASVKRAIASADIVFGG